MLDLRLPSFFDKVFLLPVYFCADRAGNGYRLFLFTLAGLASGTLLLACTDPRASPPAFLQEPARVDPSNQTNATTDTVRLTGERITQGNAVDCPQIRDDSGKVHSVSYLSPAVEIGGRVTVSGVYGVSTRCVGTVLIVQTEAPPEN